MAPNMHLDVHLIHKQFHYFNCTFIVTTVSFSQSTYNINEGAGAAQPVLVLSNPSSTDITVQVRDTENTATSK